MAAFYDGYLVAKELEGCTKLGVPLIVGDLLYEHEGVWNKAAPGIMFTNLTILPEHMEHLRPVKWRADGLDYHLDEAGMALLKELYEFDDVSEEVANG